MRKNGERMNEHKILAGAKILFFITVSVNFVISWTWCDQEPEPKMHYLRSRIILTKTGSFEGIISSHAKYHDRMSLLIQQYSQTGSVCLQPFILFKIK